MLRKLRSLIYAALQALGWQAVRRQDGSWEIQPLLRLGADHLADSRYILADPIASVFDIGANEGQAARAFLRAYPKSTVYSFEPDPGSYQRLVDATAGQPRVKPFNLALGRAAGSAKMFRFKFDQTNSLLPKAVGAEQYVADAEYLAAAGETLVEVTTLDAFCAAQSVTRIDLLKIDTQGYELEVLSGAPQLLQSGAISLIYLEVCFVRYYEGQPLFPELYQFLYDRGYRFVGLYESGFLTHYHHVGGNALFVHESLGRRREPRPLFRLGGIQIRR
ncbi:MAG TPA: FkbM family methyltransferase [Steroidobacteraceae bacterium]|jgi:FkbM family methyltransferase